MFMPHRQYKKKEDLGLKTIIIDHQPPRMIIRRKISIREAESVESEESVESVESVESEESENIINEMIWEII